MGNYHLLGTDCLHQLEDIKVGGVAREDRSLGAELIQSMEKGFFSLLIF